MSKSARIIPIAMLIAFLALSVWRGTAIAIGPQAIIPLKAPRPEEDRKDSAHELRAGNKPVVAIMTLPRREYQPGDEIELNVTLKIAPLWEIRSFDAKPKAVATQLTLGLPEGITAKGDWSHPKPSRSLAPDGHPAFAGEVTFSRALQLSGKMPAGKTSIECRVHFQACRETTCLRPQDLELTLPIEIGK